ncbi:aminoglycoside phosphotransferase family protein [Phytohabitans kaempferiae]|uniref:Aminoglycoside phosphotransferase family protein n=1 Tax=Phytohabitans kaempferiae TaxID=1620943 RepID=A0ABV6MEV0_9ACTN
MSGSRLAPALVARMVARQFPRWAGLPVTAVHSSGTDNTLFRLGTDMVVRLPAMPRAVPMLRREWEWLPRLAAHLPLPVPLPLGAGVPDGDFPYPWSVYGWIDGDTVADSPDLDLDGVAVRLGRFVAALQRIDTTGGPRSLRAQPLGPHDDEVRDAIDRLAAGGLVDPERAAAVWRDALAAPPWDGAPVWLHGDLIPANLLVRQGRLSAVIDFGLTGLGDPATDLQPAWAVLTEGSRDLFRAQLGVDEATWRRGRGWALRAGLGAVRTYRYTNPVLAAAGRHSLAQVMADFEVRP